MKKKRTAPHFTGSHRSSLVPETSLPGGSLPSEGDVVLVTPGAFSGGSIHWWKLLEPVVFQRPDGTRGRADFIVASAKYAARYRYDPTQFQTIGDFAWKDEYGLPDGLDRLLGDLEGTRKPLIFS
jgi:hypothetical protein